MWWFFQYFKKLYFWFVCVNIFTLVKVSNLFRQSSWWQALQPASMRVITPSITLLFPFLRFDRSYRLEKAVMVALIPLVRIPNFPQGVMRFGLRSSANNNAWIIHWKIYFNMKYFDLKQGYYLTNSLVSRLPFIGEVFPSQGMRTL